MGSTSCCGAVALGGAAAVAGRVAASVAGLLIGWCRAWGLCRGDRRRLRQTKRLSLLHFALSLLVNVFPIVAEFGANPLVGDHAHAAKRLHRGREFLVIGLRLGGAAPVCARGCGAVLDEAVNA